MQLFLLLTASTILLNVYVVPCNAAVVHSHHNELNRERTEDGAYSPRDHDHYSDNGEHEAHFDHMSILGNKDEADEFDHLAPDEAKRRLKILLVKMDLDGDDHIDRKELKAWLLRSFRMLAQDEAKESMEAADENNDGVVTWSEHLTYTFGSDEDDNQIDVKEEHEKLLADDKLMWKAADVNGDDVLNFEEYFAFAQPDEHPRMLPIILEQTLRDKDKNNDKAIDFQEYIEERAQEHDKDWLQDEKDKFDHDLDKDGDGKLSGNEILSWIVPSNEEIADEEVDHLFISSDDNHDDILSFEEILNHHDVFVGSEVTDYGDHLQNIHHFEDEL